VGTHKGHYRAGGRRRSYTAPKLVLVGLENRNAQVDEQGKFTHGAPYCYGSRCGKSWGCPAVPQREANALYKDLKGGALWYHYVPKQDADVQIAISDFDPSLPDGRTQFADAEEFIDHTHNL
jgi:hypothetical protein